MTETLRDITMARVTAGFSSPPVIWPIANEILATAKPTVSEMCRTLGILEGHLIVDPQITNTKKVVPRNSAEIAAKKYLVFTAITISMSGLPGESCLETFNNSSFF